MTPQADIDQEEWENPYNWGPGRFLFPVYFSSRDSRLIVPFRKPGLRILVPWGPYGNRTLNLAHPRASRVLLFHAFATIAAMIGIGCGVGRWFR